MMSSKIGEGPENLYTPFLGVVSVSFGFGKLGALRRYSDHFRPFLDTPGTYDGLENRGGPRKPLHPLPRRGKR